jgi:hypothetical protein
LHPRGETKKIYFAMGESKEKKLQGEKTKLAHITGGYQPIYPIIYY